MRSKGPATLLIAWIVHDVEEAITFPATCEKLAQRTGIGALRMDHRQSWLAVGLMGVLVSFGCRSGRKAAGGSALYRAVVAGLEGHVATHLLASAAQRGYTAGAVSAVLVMWPGAFLARRELDRQGFALNSGDYARGAALLVPSAALSHVLARLVLPCPRHGRRGPVRGAARGPRLGPARGTRAS
ncbi:MAG: HXXEE domain-containing protein [Ancrocorticia sp.]|uniref:HXXEE domain-containing protein n=1 Tax=Ancrocorticia sp. TaxID=2593684 RepID=UPI003F8ECCB9